MKTLIDRLEALSRAWKAQFDNPPTLSLSWAIDAQTGVLSLDGVGICPAESVSPAGECYDVEVLTLSLKDEGWVDIMIDWPHEGPARIAEVVTHKVVPSDVGEGS